MRTWKYDGPTELVSALAQNGRASLHDLAQATGTYPQAVRRSLERLSKEHKIWGFRAVLDERSLGWQMYIVRMSVELLDADFQTLAAGLQEIDDSEHLRILEAVVMDGDSDSNWMFVVSAHNRLAVDSFVKKYEALVKTAAAIRSASVVQPVAFALRHGGIAPPTIAEMVSSLQHSVRTRPAIN